MKKASFELGGNDPFIVLNDADVEKAAVLAYRSRMGANAQACINAKRFIVEKGVY
jgi:succinate-semialdehyde dehydrogenase/glutarate-semialdehyde dehydrogenase